MTEQQLFKNTPASLKTFVIAVVLGDGTNVISAAQADMQVPVKATLQKVTILGKQAGNLTLNVSKSTFAGFPGSLADITGGAPPALAAADKLEDAVLAGWTTAFDAGDVVRLLTSGEATITQVTAQLQFVKEPA